MEKKQPRMSPYQLRLTPDERKLYEMAAERDRRTLADWMRNALTDAARAAFEEKKGKVKE